MEHLEEKLITNYNIKLLIYCRYVIEIFVQAKHEEDIHNLKRIFKDNSVLKFKIEMNNVNKLPFFEVMLDNYSNNLKLKIYRKPTNCGRSISSSQK